MKILSLNLDEWYYEEVEKERKRIEDKIMKQRVYRMEYFRRPDVIARQREYSKRPYVVAKKKEYKIKWQQKNKEKINERKRELYQKNKIKG